MIKENVFTGSSLIAAVLASLCCILPVIAVVFGLGALSVAAIFESLRPVFLVIAFAALAFGFYQTYFRREKCDDGQACATKPIGMANKIILWTAALFVLAIVAFPYYSGLLLAALDNAPVQESTTQNVSIETENQTAGNSDESSAAETESQTRKTVVIVVEGMTCEGCASQLNVALKRVKGIISAEASYPNKNVTVVYNPKQVTIERIRKAIYDAGYTPK